jgi:hypothetical protein
LEKVTSIQRERESQLDKAQLALDKLQEERPKFIDRLDQNEKYIESLNQSLQ